MARRNKDTRITTPRRAEADRRTPATAEDQAQRRQFFMWVAVITVFLVAIIYFMLFR